MLDKPACGGPRGTQGDSCPLFGIDIREYRPSRRVHITSRGMFCVKEECFKGLGVIMVIIRTRDIFFERVKQWEKVPLQFLYIREG
jgi:hypothetical protein